MREATKVGLLAGGVITAFLLALFVFKLFTNDILPSLDLPMLIVAIIIGVRLQRQADGGEFPYIKAVGAGVVVTLMSGLLSRAFYFVWLQFVDDSLLHMIQAQWTEAGRDVPLHTPFSFASGNLLGWFVTGLLVSIIAGLFMRKRPETTAVEPTADSS